MPPATIVKRANGESADNECTSEGERRGGKCSEQARPPLLCGAGRGRLSLWTSDGDDGDKLRWIHPELPAPLLIPRDVTDNRLEARRSEALRKQSGGVKKRASALHLRGSGFESNAGGGTEGGLDGKREKGGAQAHRSWIQQKLCFRNPEAQCACAASKGADLTDSDDRVAPDTACGACHSRAAKNMLICDLCDRGYHLRCLKSPLAEVPTGEWFCPLCQHLRRNDAHFNKTARVRVFWPAYNDWFVGWVIGLRAATDDELDSAETTVVYGAPVYQVFYGFGDVHWHFLNNATFLPRDELATALAKSGDPLLGHRIEVWHAESVAVEAGWYAGTVSDVCVEQVQRFAALTLHLVRYSATDVQWHDLATTRWQHEDAALKVVKNALGVNAVGRCGVKRTAQAAAEVDSAARGRQSEALVPDFAEIRRRLESSQGDALVALLRSLVHCKVERKVLASSGVAKLVGRLERLSKLDVITAAGDAGEEVKAAAGALRLVWTAQLDAALAKEDPTALPKLVTDATISTAANPRVATTPAPSAISTGTSPTVITAKPPSAASAAVTHTATATPSAP